MQQICLMTIGGRLQLE